MDRNDKRKLKLNEDKLNKYLCKEGYNKEDQEAIRASMKALFGGDRPMTDKSINNPDKFDKYFVNTGVRPREKKQHTREELVEMLNLAVSTERYEDAAKIKKELDGISPSIS